MSGIGDTADTELKWPELGDQDSTCRVARGSFTPRALPEPCVNLSIHTAPDVQEGRMQLRLVEVAVVADPAADARVVHRGQLRQG